MTESKRRLYSIPSKVLVLGAVAFVAGVSALMAPPPGGTRGDVNFDTNVSVLDALVVLQSAAGLAVPDSFVTNPNGDVDCSATVSALDALIILSDIVGLDVSSYCIGQELVATVVLQPTYDTLFLGDTSRYSVVLLSDAGDTLSDTLPGRKVAWSTSENARVTVDSTGLATTVDTGNVTVTATSETVQSGTLSLRVHSAVDSIPVSPGSLSFNVFGAQTTLTGSARRADGSTITGVNLRWSSSDTLVARVSQTGQVTAVGDGSAQVTASAGGVTSPPTAVSVLQTASGVCSGAAGTTHSSNIVASETWTAATSPHMVTADIDVDAGAVLTIEPGVLVCLGSNVDIDFVNGSRLLAQGTPTDSIFFAAINAASPWTALRFWNAPADTSRIVHAIIEDGGSFASGVVESRDAHPLVLDSSMVQRSVSRGVYAAGSFTRVSNTIVDGTSSEGVRLDGPGLLEDSDVHNTSGHGVWVRAANTTVRDFVIDTTGSDGLVVDFVANVSVARGLIRAAAGEGLRVPGALAQLQDVRVVGSGSYGFRGVIENLNLLAPDSAAQDSLIGNTRDTLVVTGGTLNGAEQVVRPDLPWRVEGDVSVLNPGALLRVLPGATLSMASSARFFFDDGGRLWARGTPTDSVRFVPTSPTGFWEDLEFRSATSPDPFNPAPTDTSYLTNAVIERGGQFDWAIDALENHMVVVDSAQIRTSVWGGVRLGSPNSRLAHSLVDSTTSGDGVWVGVQSTLDSVEVRRVARDGILLDGHKARAEDFIVDGASRYGVEVRNFAPDSMSVERGVIQGAGSEGLRALTVVTALADVQVSGSGSYGFRGRLENLNLLAPDSASQEAILGNTRDTLVITGGVLRGGREQVVRPDVPWRLEGDISVLDSATVLRVQPGGTVRIDQFVTVLFDEGGRLWARGTPTDSVRFVPLTSPNFWETLRFRSATSADPFNPAPSDTSYITNAVLERGGRSGFWSIDAGENHMVVVDSSSIRLMDFHGVLLSSPGSRLAHSEVGPNANANGDGVYLGANTTLDSTTVSGIKRDGVILDGRKARAEDFVVDSTGRYGLEVRSFAGDSIAVERGLVQNAGTQGLRALTSMVALNGVRVTGSGTYGFVGLLENLNLLAPDSAAQDSLTGNVRDTLVITGGTLRGAEQVVRADLPWRVDGDLDVLDPGGLLRVLPGATVAMNQFTEISFDLGGELRARGTPTDSVRFVSAAPPGFWDRLIFRSASAPDPFDPVPSDTSYISHAVLERSGRSGQWAIDAGDNHMVVVDSSSIRLVEYHGVLLNSPGSRITYSHVGPNANANGDGVYLGAHATLDSTTVSGIKRDGIVLDGRLARAEDFVVDSAGRYGLEVRSFAGDSIAVERGLVQNAGTQGLRALTSMVALNGVRVTGSGTYGFVGLLENLNLLAPDSAAQDSLTGNVRDTLIITGGTLRGAEQVVRADLPWRVDGDLDVLDPGGLLRVLPGATVAMNQFTEISFDLGGELWARGTPTDSVRFVSAAPPGFWDRLIFRSASSADPFNPAPSDTSFITHAVLERSGRSGQWAIDAGANHRVVVDSSSIRLMDYHGVLLNSPGSRITYSHVGPNANANGDGVYLGAYATLDSTTVSGIKRDGIVLDGRVARAEDFVVDSTGRYGLEVRSFAGDSITVERGLIQQAGTEGLRTFTAMAALNGVRVTGSGTYGYNGLVQNLNLLAPDSAAQDSLIGNARDTLIIAGGTLNGAEQVVRPALPWRVTSDVSIESAGGLLRVLPGATVAFDQFAWLAFNNGGRLWARGTPTDTVRFVSSAPPNFWEAIRFFGTPTDTSYITNAVVERGGRSSFFAISGESATHPVVVDSTKVRLTQSLGVLLAGAGSRLSRTLVDQTATGNAVELRDLTLMEGSRVTGAAGDGLVINGDSVLVRDSELTANVGDGIRVTTQQRVHINNNNLFGNGGLGVRNDNTGNATYLVDATGNWWGDATGPNGPSGDGVTANVDFTGFLLSALSIILP